MSTKQTIVGVSALTLPVPHVLVYVRGADGQVRTTQAMREFKSNEEAEAFTAGIIEGLKFSRAFSVGDEIK